MKKVFLTLVVLILVFLGISDIQAHEMPSQTGVVRNVLYEDSDDISDTETVKQLVTIEILTGDFKGEKIIIDNMLTNNPGYDIKLSKGNKVVLHLEPKNDIINSVDDVDFFIADVKRDTQMLVFVGIFTLLLLIIGRKKGVRSVISIITTIALIFLALVPMVLSGFSPIISSVIISILSTIVTIYLVGGLNSKSTSAVLGTSISLIFAGIFAIIAIYYAYLTGFAGEETLFLYASRPDLDFRGILAASIIIAALGALMDTSVSIASTINEIHETDKNLSVSQLFKSGMNVGRDIIGTMSNTLILVYLGSSLPLILLSTNIDINKFFNLNQVATEILSALIGSIAILLCVPITAIIAATFVKHQKIHSKQNFDLDKYEFEE